MQTNGHTLTLVVALRCLMFVACSILEADHDDEAIPAPAFVVTAEALNGRGSPSTNSASVGRATRGTEFVPLHTSGHWYGVLMSDGTTGWLHKDSVATSAKGKT